MSKKYYCSGCKRYHYDKGKWKIEVESWWSNFTHKWCLKAWNRKVKREAI